MAYFDENGNWVEGDDPNSWANLGSTNALTDPNYFSNYWNTQNQIDQGNYIPQGAVQQDSNGNWLDSLGNIIKEYAPGVIQAGVSGLIGPALANWQSGGLLNQAQDMLRSGVGAVNAVQTPNLAALIPQLQQQVMQGQITPEQYQVINAVVQGQMTPAEASATLQQQSQMGGINSDPATIAGARQALSQLNEVAQNKGVTQADRAQFNALMNQQNANAAQQRAGQLQQLQMQGNRGGGAETLARLLGTQGAANANAAAGANLAQSAQQRALQAMQAGLTGNLNLNSQQFEQEAKKAQAQDLVNQFNAQAQNQIAMQNAQQRQAANLANFNTANQMALQNAQMGNQAAQYNAGNRQAANIGNFNMANDIGRFNTNIQNENLKMPIQAAQQQFENQSQRARDIASANLMGSNALGKFATDQYNRTQNMTNTPTVGVGSNVNPGTGTAAPSTADKVKGGLLNAAIDLGTNWLKSKISDENLKTDKKQLSDVDIENIMDDLTGYKYRYKNGKDTKKNPVEIGVMAQDMPKTSVVDTPAGKMYQKQEALSTIMAALPNLHNRISKLENK